MRPRKHTRSRYAVCNQGREGGAHKSTPESSKLWQSSTPPLPGGEVWNLDLKVSRGYFLR